MNVFKQKKEIKDNQTIISCLRKQIAISKLTQKPVTDLDQFSILPRAISDANGIPENGQKYAALQIFESLYKEAFVSFLPDSKNENTCIAVIIEGMFIINTSPLSTHKTFDDYAEFLFQRWVTRSQFQFKASEIHIIFDHPNRHGISPKDIERSRRDKNCKIIFHGTCISDKTDLPKTNWRHFLSDRVQKRNLVNFLSEKFLELAQSKFHEKNYSCDIWWL